MTHRIDATQLIPGRGKPVQDAVVILEDDVVRFAGPAAQAPATPGATTVTAHTVMPGLWDSHVHLFGLRSADLNDLLLEPVALRSARCVTDLRRALDAGITSVREVGGLGVNLARAVNEGTIDGPRIYAAGAAISVTGGHGDMHSFPLPWMHAAAETGGELRLADGVSECVKAVREQLRRNAKLIKIYASGGVLSEVDHPIHQQFTGAEIRAMVEVAGLADRIVAAHCHGKPGMMAAIANGVRTIEHGTYIDEEVADAMRETGTILVTTRTIMQELVDSGELPAYAASKLETVIQRHAEALMIARERRVKVAAGTDVALSGVTVPDSWGRNGRELPLLVELGYTPLDVIEAATATGPETLGPQAPKSGQLIPGYDADLLIVDSDPLADIAILAQPDHITGVWKAGTRVK
jgi:imidazolonepropionase-like amidohydrolase